MGLFDDLKMATGLGLEPTEAYRRAFDKGVLLGSSKFNDAADMFKTAAEKLAPTNPQLAARASANASLYRFLAKREPSAAWEAAQLLRSIPSIEVPGTADEIMDGKVLATELDARRLEADADRAFKANSGQAPDAYRQAAQAWLLMRSDRPVTFALTGDDQEADDGMTRFFFNAAQAEFAEAVAAESTNPDLAAERFAMAAQAFGRCSAAEARNQAKERLRACRLERPCWFCGRVVRGLNTNLRRLPTVSSDYFVRLAKADRARGEAFEPPSSIFACAACAEAIDTIAVHRADEVRQEVTAKIGSLEATIDRLESRITDVERRAHSHVGSA